MPAAWFTVDVLTVAVEKDTLEVFNPCRLELVLHTQCCQFPHAMGQERDADPEFLDFGNRLIDLAAEPLALEAQRQCEAGDAATHNGDVDIF